MPAYENMFYDMIEDSMANDSRTLQRAVGPSGIGTECYHCLGCMIAQVPKMESRQEIWNQWLGKAGHDRMEQILQGVNEDAGMELFLTEKRVPVGWVGDFLLEGSADCYDVQNEVVIDWKFPGDNTLRKVKSGKISPTYRTQAHCYGMGFENLGYPVSRVMVLFLPRNARTVREAVPFIEQYDPNVALAALKRADDIYRLMYEYGSKNVIPRLKRAPGCYDCSRYAI